MQQIVRQLAAEHGFHLSGISPVLESEASPTGPGRTVPEIAYLEQWIDEGRAGEMEYLKRRNQDGELLRSSIRVPFPWARSVIVCAVNYNSAQPRSIDPISHEDNGPQGARGPRGWIARYAWSGQRREPPESDAPLAPADYHAVIRTRLENLRQALQSKLGSFEARCFVDTGPLVERVYAKYAGLGWQGKNTCLIDESLGSWLFLGVIITSLELPQSAWPPPAPDRCGSCTRCIDACPTDALEPYRMDATRCIAYLTIEKRGLIPEELAAKVGRHVFGCDICQEVCPWNRRAPVTDWPELQPRQELVNPALDWLAGLTEDDFRTLFRKSPVERTKYAGFVRNVRNAIQNAEPQAQAGAGEILSAAKQGLSE